MSDQFLQKPQEFIECLVGRSNCNSSINDRGKGVAVFTCSDPRVADVIKGMDAQFIRTPGVEIDPLWNDLERLMGKRAPPASLFLCHDQCVAHGGRLEMARKAVLRTRQVFWGQYGRAGGVFLAGQVDVASRRITFFDDDGLSQSLYDLRRVVPIHSREAIGPIFELNAKRQPSSTRDTTLLHSLTGVLAISIAGALNDMRERNLAYVIDWMGQDEETFAKQIRLLGNICLINSPTPHLVVVAPAEEAKKAYAILVHATSAISGMERGHCFTTELAVRHSSIGTKV